MILRCVHKLLGCYTITQQWGWEQNDTSLYSYQITILQKTSSRNRWDAFFKWMKPALQGLSETGQVAISLGWQTEHIRSCLLTHMLLIKGFISFLCTHRLLLQSPLRELCLPSGVWKTFPCSLHTNLLWRTRGPHQTALPCNSFLNACFQNKPKRETNAYSIRGSGMLC